MILRGNPVHFEFDGFVKLPQVTDIRRTVVKDRILVLLYFIYVVLISNNQVVSYSVFVDKRVHDFVFTDNTKEIFSIKQSKASWLVNHTSAIGPCLVSALLSVLCIGFVDFFLGHPLGYFYKRRNTPSYGEIIAFDFVIFVVVVKLVRFFLDNHIAISITIIAVT